VYVACIDYVVGFVGDNVWNCSMRIQDLYVGAFPPLLGTFHCLLGTFLFVVCVECLIGKQKKPILFKVTEPSSVPLGGKCIRVKCISG
jgi:hypothetical protein